MHDLTEFCSATLIEFGNKWSRLGADVQEQVEKAVDDPYVDVNWNVIIEAQQVLKGVNNEIDEGLERWLDAEAARNVENEDDRKEED